MPSPLRQRCLQASYFRLGCSQVNCWATLGSKLGRVSFGSVDGVGGSRGTFLQVHISCGRKNAPGARGTFLLEPCVEGAKSAGRQPCLDKMGQIEKVNQLRIAWLLKLPVLVQC